MKNQNEIFVQEADKLLNRYFPYGKSGIMPAQKEYFGFFTNHVGIYVLYAPKEGFSDEIVYIGMSQSIGARLSSHLCRNDSSFKEKGISKIRIIRIPDRAGWPILKLEAVLIDRLKPKYNKINPYLSETSPIPAIVDLESLVEELIAP